MDQEQVNHYDAVIADLEAQREKLWSLIVALKSLKQLGMPLDKVAAFVSGEPTTAVLAPEVPLPHDAFFGLTIPDAARKYLASVKGTRPHPDLCDALLRGGFKTSATNFREVVRSTLGRHPDFVKINGQWGLREWYPGRGGGRKAKRSPEQSESRTPIEAILQPEENDPKT
jgi:hypothetical protein